MHFRDFEQPFFSLCVRCDVTHLKAALARRPGNGRLSLALHYQALRLANEQTPFRMRLQGQGDDSKVLVYGRVDASTTVLRADESFGFAILRWQPSYRQFEQVSAAALAKVMVGPPNLSEPTQSEMDAAPLAAPGAATYAAPLMYFTTLPWVHFSSFAHARCGHGPADSTPRVAFGRIDVEGAGAQARRPVIGCQLRWTFITR